MMNANTHTENQHETAADRQHRTRMSLREMMRPAPPSIRQQNEWITERTLDSAWLLTMEKAKALPREEGIQLMSAWTLWRMSHDPIHNPARVEEWFSNHVFKQPTTDASLYQLAFNKAQAKQSDLSD